MTWLTIIAIIVIGGGIYVIAKQRGKREKAEEISDKAAAIDKREIEDELQKKRDTNAFDNLNDTLDDLGK